MQISVQQLDKLIVLYRAEYGVELDRKEAEKLGKYLVRLVGAVYSPSETIKGTIPV